MPKCDRCNHHFKFEGDKVCWLIKEQIGANICKDCKSEYLETTRQKVIGATNEQNIR